MFKKFNIKLKLKNEVIALITLIILTSIFTVYHNQTKNRINNNYKKIIENFYFKKTVNHFFEKFEPRFKKISHKVREGETFMGILEFYSLNKDEISTIKNKINNKINLNRLNTNQKILFTIDQTDNSIQEFIFQISNKERIILTLDTTNKNFKQEIVLTKLEKEIVYSESTILNSLYKSAKDQKVPTNIIIEFARIYGFQVDFQRDIRKKDKFQIMYEAYVDEKKRLIETGNILFANLVLSGEDNSLFYFDGEKNTGHYDKNGRSIEKALMKTPINGARLSSPFGKRKHPILGFTKHHNGTDFAAPTGTPIMASGNGTVIKAGWCGNGGNCVRIRHNSSYTTGYGHMSKIATKRGRRVRQGQIIGYVGSTGMSTGPHLHYTVSYNGKFINSQKLKLPSGKILKGEQRKKFEVQRIKLDVALGELISKI